MKCPLCQQHMEFSRQIGECCINDACPVLDDALLWYRNSKGEWCRQKWVETKTETGYNLKLSPKED
jgi:hypothetical protein